MGLISGLTHFHFRRKSLRDRHLHRRLGFRSLGAFLSPGASDPSGPVPAIPPRRLATADPRGILAPPGTVTTPSPHQILTVVPLQSLQRYYGEVPVRSWCGKGEEGEELGSKSLPFAGNRANPALIGWRNAANREWRPRLNRPARTVRKPRRATRPRRWRRRSER